MDHRTEAEQLLAMSENYDLGRTGAERIQLATQAQAHATLALVSALLAVAYEPMDPEDFARIRRELGERSRARVEKPAGQTWGGTTVSEAAEAATTLRERLAARPRPPHRSARDVSNEDIDHERRRWKDPLFEAASRASAYLAELTAYQVAWVTAETLKEYGWRPPMGDGDD